MSRNNDSTKFLIKSNNVRVIHDDVIWWHYENTKEGYDATRGAFAPLRPEGDPVTASFHDWNSHVGMLYAGVVDIEGHGKNTVRLPPAISNRKH